MRLVQLMSIPGTPLPPDHSDIPPHHEKLTLAPSLVGSGHLDKAAIISAAGDSIWSSTPGFTLKPEEMKHIADILDNAAGAADKAYAEGLFVGGVRYVLTKAEGRSLYARQVRGGNIHRSGGGVRKQ